MSLMSRLRHQSLFGYPPLPMCGGVIMRWLPMVIFPMHRSITASCWDHTMTVATMMRSLMRRVVSPQVTINRSKRAVARYLVVTSRR